jgi:Peptidase family M23
MMAAGGTPLIAVADGVISEKINDPVWSGLGLAITDRSGTRYFYAHLSGFASGVYVGKRVHLGDVIGYVGNTGDAAGGPTHLHFEVHPYGGPAVPPKPYVDSWLDVAQVHAMDLVLKMTGKKVTNANLDLSFWKGRLLKLVQREVHAGQVLAARQASAAAKTKARRDQQALPYGLPVVGLALLAGAMLLVDRRRLARPLGEPFAEVADERNGLLALGEL